MYNKLLKPFLDILCAIVAFAILSPIFMIIVLILAVYQNGQIFFTQNRSGKNKQIFRLIKFKTMVDAWDADGKPLPDDKRLTVVGKVIRKSSLDELPQLINVIKGDMSFVGPRPLLIEYSELYNKKQQRRHEVMPGITGWAQVNGRNAISWEKKFEYDVWYVDNQSIGLDVKILFLTLFKVFKADGVSAEDHVTIERFKGSGSK